MIFLSFALLGLGIVIGHTIGHDRGKTAIQRRLLQHVIESPEYESHIVKHFTKAFNEMNGVE